MIIQHNISAINSHRQLGINNNATAKNLEKLSSGYRINRAGDDAAGLAISEKMRGQIRGLAMAEQNCENGISLIQTAEGGLNETHAILQRMRELAVQASNGTYDDEVDRANINKEVEALKSEIDRIAASTHYNGINLLDGSMGGKKVGVGGAVSLGEAIGITAHATNGAFLKGETGTLTILGSGADATFSLQVGDKTYIAGPAASGTVSFYDPTVGSTTTIATMTLSDPPTVVAGVATNLLFDATTGATSATADTVVATATSELIFQIGANGTADQQVGLHVDNMSSGAIGEGTATRSVASISLATRDLANDAIKVITAATNQVSGTRADLGALQNRLEHTLNNLGVTKENLTAAESTIRDVDMAKEMMEFTKNNILVQASQAMLAQANQLPQGVLQLLR